jgi:RNA polymerase sigma factor (sigma-70 family)
MSSSALADIETLAPATSFPLNCSTLERIALGDQTAVDDCLSKFGGLVWSLARRLSKTPADAEDAVQEIFVEIWQSAERYDPKKAAETTFIAMIARRRLIDRLRRSGAGMETVSMESQMLDIACESRHNQVDVEDDARKAAQCMEKLSEKQQQILRLSIHDGVSHGGISEKLSIPLGTVKSFARRGLLQLRDCMNRNATLHTAESNT